MHVGGQRHRRRSLSFLIDAHPDRIGRLVLTNCGRASTSSCRFRFNGFAPGCAHPPRRRGSWRRPWGPRHWCHSPVGFGPLANDRIRRSPRRDPAGRLRLPHRRRLPQPRAPRYRTHRPHRGRALLQRFTRPVRLVGTADRCFTTKLGRRLAAQFPTPPSSRFRARKRGPPPDNPRAVVDESSINGGLRDPDSAVGRGCGTPRPPSAKGREDRSPTRSISLGSPTGRPTDPASSMPSRK